MLWQFSLAAGQPHLVIPAHRPPLRPDQSAICERTGTRHEPAKPAKVTSYDVRETRQERAKRAIQRNLRPPNMNLKKQSGRKVAKGADSDTLLCCPDSAGQTGGCMISGQKSGHCVRIPSIHYPLTTSHFFPHGQTNQRKARRSASHTHPLTHSLPPTPFFQIFVLRCRFCARNQSSAMIRYQKR